MYSHGEVPKEGPAMGAWAVLSTLKAEIEQRMTDAIIDGDSSKEEAYYTTLMLIEDQLKLL